MKVKELIAFFDDWAPPAYQESYDNSGHLVGHTEDTINSAIISLDVTEQVIDEAIQKGANLIISHHPIIFGGVKRLTGQNYVQRVVQKAIKNDINLFAIHTNLDNVYENGVNTYWANMLNLNNVELLRLKKDLGTAQEPVGSGAIGLLAEPMPEEEFLKHLKHVLELDCIKHTALRNKRVQKVALCGGSGRFLLNDAIAQKADVFVSSDFKYHEYFDADNQIVIADIGHYESERHTIKMIHEILTNKFRNFASHYTEVNTNPINYL